MPPTAGGLDQQVTGPLGQQRPQGGQPLGTVDVDPQKPGVGDRVLGAARLGARRRPDERLLARRSRRTGRGCSRRRRFAARARADRSSQPRCAGRAAGQEVLAPVAPVDLDLAARRTRARGELDEPVGLGVQQPEMQRPMALRRQLAAEHPPVGEPHPAAQPRRRLAPSRPLPASPASPDSCVPRERRRLLGSRRGSRAVADGRCARPGGGVVRRSRGRSPRRPRGPRRRR